MKAAVEYMDSKQLRCKLVAKMVLGTVVVALVRSREAVRQDPLSVVACPAL